MAAADNTVYDTLLGRTGELDGHLITAALYTDTYTPLTTDPTLTAITGEATGAGYTRQTFTCAVIDGVCHVDIPDQWPDFNTSGLADPHNRVVLALGEDIGDLPAGTLVSNILVGDQVPSTSWLFEPVNGFARPRRTPVVPPPTGDAGQVPTTDGTGNYVLGAPSSAPTTFIYNSSGAQTGNRYNDETALWAAVAAAPYGAKDIIVEQDETFTTPAINLNGGGFMGVNQRILLTFDGSVTQITNPGIFLARTAVFLYNTSLTDSVLKVDGTHANSVILEDSCAILAAGVDGDGPGFVEITEATAAAGIGLNNAHLYRPSDISIGSSSTDGPALVVSGGASFPYIGCGWGHCEIKPDTIKSDGNVYIVNFTAGLDATRTPGSPVLAGQTMATVIIALDTNLAVNIKYDHTASGLTATDTQGALDELADLASSIADAAAMASTALAAASDLDGAQAALAPFLAAFTAP